MARSLRHSCALLLAGVALLAAGCGSDDAIKTYKVPRATERDAKPRTAAYRILGAIYPADKPAWFFKFSGSIEHVAKYEAEFDKLAASVKLQGDVVPAFDLPEGWKKTGPRSRSGITTDEVLKFGPENSFEVTITSSGGGLKANLQRWIDQLDADDDASNPSTFAKPFDAVGGKGLRVDLRGPKNPTGGPMMKPR